jgi:hypothetical protein
MRPREKVTMRRKILVLVTPLCLLGVFLFPLLGRASIAAAGVPPAGSSVTGAPPGGVEVAPGVYEFQGSARPGVSPDWTDICTGNPGYVCFYAPNSNTTFAYYEGSSQPIDYDVTYPPYTEYDNWIGYRVWLHQYTNWLNHGWSYCISPYGGPASVPSQYQNTADVYVSANNANCP